MYKCNSLTREKKKTSFPLIIFKLHYHMHKVILSPFIYLFFYFNTENWRENSNCSGSISYRKHKLEYPPLARTSAVQEEVPAANPLAYRRAILAPSQDLEWARAQLLEPPMWKTHTHIGEPLGRASEEGTAAGAGWVVEKSPVGGQKSWHQAVPVVLSITGAIGKPLVPAHISSLLRGFTQGSTPGGLSEDV